MINLISEKVVDHTSSVAEFFLWGLPIYRTWKALSMNRSEKIAVRKVDNLIEVVNRYVFDPISMEYFFYKTSAL